MPRKSAFQLQSPREFGFMCDCVASHVSPTSQDWTDVQQHFGISETNELTLGEYCYDIDHHSQGSGRRRLRSRVRGLHRSEADPGAN
jgi:hypothetical protein